MELTANLIGNVAVVLSLLAAGWRLMRHMDSKMERLSDQMSTQIGDVQDQIGDVRNQIGDVRDRVSRIEGYLMALPIPVPPLHKADSETP